MSDSSRWSKYVESKSAEFRDQGFAVNFRAIEAPTKKTAIEVRNSNIQASAYFWETSYADDDILEAKANRFVASEANTKFSGQTFEAHIEKFAENCLKFREQ